MEDILYLIAEYLLGSEHPRYQVSIALFSVRATQFTYFYKVKHQKILYYENISISK